MSESSKFKFGLMKEKDCGRVYKRYHVRHN